VILISAGASFFFSLAETALFSLGKWQARQLAERDPITGGRVLHLLAEAQDLLATMVLGNTFATAAMLATGFWMALRDSWYLIPTIIGLFIDAAVVGAVMLVGTLVPSARIVERAQGRWVAIACASILTAIPIALSVLGYLEGELKSV
jgi:Mg2+/Co2+ transporter CorB